MILVTGAAGKTGQAVLRSLQESEAPIRAQVFRSEQAGRLDGIDVADVLIGDVRDPAIIEAAVREVQAIYHIPPNVSPDEVVIGKAIIDAAREKGTERFVYHSVLHPQIEAMPHHWQKMRVEEHLLNSGLDFTILQPTAYMQNLFAHWDQITDEGRFPVPYSPEVRLSLIDLEDVAEVAATVLLNHDHSGAIYELAGSHPISQLEVAETLSQELGSPVRVDPISREAWEAEARDRGIGEYQLTALLAMFKYYDQHGLYGNPKVLTWLLGRAPTTLESVILREQRQRVALR